MNTQHSVYTLKHWSGIGLETSSGRIMKDNVYRTENTGWTEEAQTLDTTRWKEEDLMKDGITGRAQ